MAAWRMGWQQTGSWGGFGSPGIEARDAKGGRRLDQAVAWAGPAGGAQGCGAGFAPEHLTHPALETNRPGTVPARPASLKRPRRQAPSPAARRKETRYAHRDAL
jgi:hypothetical protein